MTKHDLTKISMTFVSCLLLMTGKKKKRNQNNFVQHRNHDTFMLEIWDLKKTSVHGMNASTNTVQIETVQAHKLVLYVAS